MKSVQLFAAAMLIFVSFSVQAQGPPDPTPGATKPVREQNLDENEWIAVHEQGTANVEVQGIADVYVTGGEIDASITGGQVEVTNKVIVEVDNFPAVQEVTGLVEVTEYLEAVVLDARICTKDVKGLVTLSIEIPEGMVLVLEDATFEVQRCNGDEASAITPNQLSAGVGSLVFGQFNDAVIGTGAFSGRSFNKQVRTYHTGYIHPMVWIDPPDYVSGVFFRGYGRLLPGTRTWLYD